MSRPQLRLGIRSRLLLAVVAAVAVTLAAITAIFNVVLAQRLAANADSVARARAQAQLATLRISGGRVELREASDRGVNDPQVWVLSRGRLVEAPRAAIPDATAAAVRLARSGAAFVDVPEADLRLASVAVLGRRGKVGAVVAGVALGPYEESRTTALVASALLALAALAAVTLAARWILGRALGPVGRMTADAEAWSERELDRRFALGAPHDELTQLAATLDRLLDRLAASLRHEQRMTAELSHELRTPLARIAAEAELGLRRDRSSDEYREALATIDRNSRQMTRTIDALMAAAREESSRGNVVDLATVVAGVAADWASPAADSGIAIDLELAHEPVRAAVSSDLAERMVHPLLENACRHASRRVRLALSCDDAHAVIAIDDDGPGVPVAQRAAIFEPGFRDGAVASDGGAGLGLPLARRLARAAGGDVEIAGGTTGASFRITLPRVSY